jgi:segregation and condensation protein A
MLTDAKISEKPFWLGPPWAVLFDLIRLQKIRPWDVNLNHLLTTLAGEMRKRGYVDFTASGIALFSSSVIYRMKSELILKLEEPPKPPVERPVEFLPPPLQLPYRYEYTSTTIENLLRALEEALKTETAAQLQPRFTPITPAPPVVQEIDDFMVNIEKKLEEMYNRIAKLAPVGKTPLSNLDDRLSRLDSVRLFILILFLACRGEIQLWQDEEFGEIYVSLPESGEVNGNRTDTGT